MGLSVDDYEDKNVACYRKKVEIAFATRTQSLFSISERLFQEAKGFGSLGAKVFEQEDLTFVSL